MRRRIVPFVLVLAVAGCSSAPLTTTLVPNDPLVSGPAAPPPQHVTCTPASVEDAARVDQLGQRIVLANPQAGARPVRFVIVGSPQPMLIHRNSSEVVISEGLVRRCATDGQLAALLAYELARLVAERESLAAVSTRQPDREPPPDIRIGNDNAGSFGPADMTRQAELAKFQPSSRRDPSKPLPPPDPHELAITYLKSAGFQQGDLDAVAALLQPGAGTPGLERQLMGTPPAAH
jgi:hypothetical protein